MKRTVVLAGLTLLLLAFVSSANAESERSLFGLRSFVGL